MSTDYIDLSQLTADISTPQTGPVPPDQQVINSTTEFFGGLPQDLFNLASDLQTLLSQLLGLVKTAVDDVESVNLTSVIASMTVGLKWFTHLDSLFNIDLWNFFQNDVVGGSLYTAITEWLGIDPNAIDDDLKAGLHTATSVVTNGTMLQVAVAAASTALEAILGDRAPKKAMEMITKIPEEVGINFAVGTVMAGIFEAALGTQLERGIKHAKRPEEPDWRIVRTLIRQHIPLPVSIERLLANEGYSDVWVKAITALEEQPIPLGDIAQMFRQGILDSDQVDTLMVQLGFSDSNRHLLRQSYIDKAATESGGLLRATARTLAIHQIIDIPTYRTILEQVNYPPLEIADDVQALTMEISLGRTTYSTAAIKSAYLHKMISPSTATSQLLQLGMTAGAVQELIQSWEAPRIPRTHGLTESQILKYYNAGLLSGYQAQIDLQALGVEGDAISFLLAHPLSTSGAHTVRLTPALVTEAYLAGALQPSDLSAAYTKAGATDDTLPYLLANAQYKYSRHHEAGSGTQPLPEGKILEAYKYGLFDQTTATTALMQLGYSKSNATLLIEIENHGPIQPAGEPIFTSLQAAIDYLINEGFTLNSPSAQITDTNAAIQTVEQAGISVVYPTNWNPAPTPVGSNFGGGAVAGGTP